MQTPTFFAPGLEVVGSRTTTPVNSSPANTVPPSQTPSRLASRAAKRRNSMMLNTPPNISGPWEPSYDEVLARVNEDAKAVSDEEIPEEDQPTPRDDNDEEEEPVEDAPKEKPLQQFHTLPVPKTKPWMRRKTTFGDGK